MVGRKSAPRAFRRALPIDVDASGGPSAVLAARSDETPTSQKLQAVVERRPTARRRRRRAVEVATPVPVSGFPVPGNTPLVVKSETAPPSVEAGRREVGRDVGGEGFEENDRIIAAMSQAEIDEEVASLREMFSDEAFAGLQTLAGKRRGDVERKEVTGERRVSFAQNEEKGNDGGNEGRSDTFTYPSARVQPRGDARDEDVTSLVRLGSDFREDMSRMRAANGELAGVVEDVLSLEHAAREGAESEKLSWTGEADVPVPESGEDLDAAVQKSVDALGEVADWRFDLRGRRLSDDDVRSLPMHLGLHHHGAQPDSAGYTLGEMLLLARSTVVGQRAAALQMFAGVFSRHGSEVVSPLASAGGIAALLADASIGEAESIERTRPGGIAVSQNVSLSAAFVRCVFELVLFEEKQNMRLCSGLSADVADTEQLYFVSSLYASPDPSVEIDLHEKQPVVKVLGESGCVSRLVLIAGAARSTGNVDISIKALRSCLFISRYSTSAALTVALSNATCMDLFDMALPFEGFRSEVDAGDAIGVGSSKNEPGNFRMPLSPEGCEVMQHACEVISVCILASGWAGELALLNRPKGLGDAGRLERLLMLRVDGVELERCARESEWDAFTCASSALRVLRSLFTFGLGIGAAGRITRGGLPYLVTTALPSYTEASPVARVTCSKARTEAFLALESYVHSLFADIVAVEKERKAGAGGDHYADNAIESISSSQARVVFAQGELQYLMSTAIEAALHFTGNGPWSANDSCGLTATCSRAAAGHFMATMMAMTSVSKHLFNPEFVGHVYSVACETAESLDALAIAIRTECSIDTIFSMEQSLCAGLSVVHAAGRLIPHSKSLLISNITSVVEHLSNVFGALSVTGSSSLLREITCSTSLNAFAEWLGLQAQISPSRATALRGLDLLGHCREAQVCADIVTRCVLSRDLILSLDPKMTGSEAAGAIAVLLPATLVELFRSRKVQGSVDGEDGSPDDRLELPLLSSRHLLVFWLAGDAEIRSSAFSILRALRLGLVISPNVAFQALVLGIPSNAWFDVSSETAKDFGSALSCEVIAAGESASVNLFSEFDDTRMPSFSTLSAPSMATSLISISECLLEHGPLSRDSPSGIRGIANVLLSAMLRSREVDSSLRRILWRMTVSDCGGMALFNGARVLGGGIWTDAEDILSPQYAELLCGPRGLVESSETRDVFYALLPSLLARKPEIVALLSSPVGRKAVSVWHDRERSSPTSSLSADFIDRLDFSSFGIGSSAQLGESSGIIGN